MKFFLLIFIIVNSLSLSANEQIKLSEAQLYNLGVKLGKPEVISSVPLLDAPAKVTIPPTHEYIVSTSHAGLVNKIEVTIGDEVEKGQLLATINSPELIALQRHHLQSINDLKLAKAEFNREKKLYTEGLIADRRWLKTQTHYHVVVSHLNETRQLLTIAGLSKEEIKRLEKKHRLNSQLKVVAPISGVVLERYVTTGERVDALGPLFQVANLKKLWLDISIPQQRINLVNLGDKVAIQKMNVTARIFLLGKNVDDENQTVLVRAEIESGLDSIRPGQTVNAQISQSSENAMFKVPNSALAQFQGVNYVFLRTETGFTAQPVQVLGREESKTIIAGEIQKNSEIALRGAVALKANLLGLGGDE